MSMIVILTRARTAEPVLTWLMTTNALVSQGTLAKTALKVKMVCVTIKKKKTRRKNNQHSSSMPQTSRTVKVAGVRNLVYIYC